jgi:hypothetical protein
VTNSTKRAIAYGAAVGVTILALLAIFIDSKREETLLPNPPQLGSPILLAFSPGLKEFEGDIIAAVSQFNREVNCPVFSLTTPSNARAVLKWLDTEACGGRGKPLKSEHVEGMWDCKDGTAEVQFADLAHPDMRFPVIVHALGHVAGLAHDTSGLSVMLDPPPPMVHGKLAPGLTRKDIGALRDRYCR